MSDRDTDFGFQWGPVEVERSATIKRGPKGEAHVLRVKTAAPSQELHIYVSRTGRSVRVWQNGKELK